GAHLRAELRPVLFTRLAVLLFVEQLVRLQVGLAGIDHDVRFEVEDALETAQRDVEQVADAARQSFEEPDMAHRRGESDVPEALAADLRLRHFDAALVANHAAMLHALVLAAQTFPVGDRTEDLRAEQPVAFRLERPVVDRFRLGHLAVRPRHDLVRRGEADTNRIEIAGQRAAFVKAWSHRHPSKSLRIADRGLRIGIESTRSTPLPIPAAEPPPPVSSSSSSAPRPDTTTGACG